MVKHGKTARGFPHFTLTRSAPEGGTSRWRVGGQCLFGIALFFLADWLMFGSGFYFHWVAPESSAGTISVAMETLGQIPTGRTAILVLGDSRVAEGFSAPIAQQEAGGRGGSYAFFNAAVPGTTPRVWFYLLRQMRDRPQRLAAVALMLTSYGDNDQENLADRGSDIAFLHPLLRLDDLRDFLWSFPSAVNRLQAIEAILLGGMFYGADLRQFMADPFGRVHSVIAWRRHGYDWIRDYPGRGGSLAGLAFDPESGRLTLPAGRSAGQTTLLPAYVAQLLRSPSRPPDNAAAAKYRRFWLARIAELCRQARVPVLVFRIPRGPLDYLAPVDSAPSGVLARMAAAGTVQVLPAELFTPLERPEFFFDRLHLNRAGRHRFSTLLAKAILQRMPAQPLVR